MLKLIATILFTTYLARICIEFDARIGRRNYEGLTPVGVARMNGHSEFIELLNSHYMLDEDDTPSGRDEPEKLIYKRTNQSSIRSQNILREDERQRR